MARARATAVAAVLGLVLAALALVHSLDASPAAAQVTSTDDALILAGAIAGPGAVVSGAEFVSTPVQQNENPLPNGVADDVVGDFPRDGPTHLVMTTGDAERAYDANSNPSEAPSDRQSADDESTNLGGGNVRGDTDFDVSILRIDLDVPVTANCVSLDFQFLSEEYPDFVDLAFNDAFIAELDESTWETSGAEISAPDNFAFSPDGDDEGEEPDVVSVNSVGPIGFSPANADGTTYDGATQLLSAAKPVTAGAHSLFLSIFDQGDNILDSAVFVDNLRVGYVSDPAAQCVAGAQVKQFELTLAPTTHVGFTGDQHTLVATLNDLNADPSAVEDAPIRLTVTGANPTGTTASTNQDGLAEFAYTGAAAGADAISVCYDADESGSCDADEPFASATATWEVLERPRVAFTDDRDRSVEVEMSRIFVDHDGNQSTAEQEHFGGEPFRRLGIGATRHTGEASPAGFGGIYVSTVDEPHGELYESHSDGPLTFGDAFDRRRLTCDNTAIETHPVYNYDDGWFAWASDIDGDWEIYVASETEGTIPADERVGGACENYEAFQLTDNDTDDLWPAWTPDGTALYFSSTTDDPHGEIYRMVVDDGEVQSVVRQTDSESADSQPSVTTYKGEEWVAFTTTRFRGEGSVAFARARLSAADPVPEAHSAWGGGEPSQSEEPSWGGESDDPNLAYTSRALDPYGDVWVADIFASGSGATPRIARSDPVASLRGVAETHPTWHLVWDDGGGGLGRPAPAWALAGPLPTVLPVSLGASLFVTVRTIDADISDVLAEDGSQRRRILAQAAGGRTLDEAGPDYSPDGEQLTFSRVASDDTPRPCTRTFFSSSPAFPISDPIGGALPPPPTEMPLQTPRPGRIADIDVTLNLQHTSIGDLSISVARGSQMVDLSSNNGGASDNFTGTTFDDEASQSVTTIPGDDSQSPHSGRYRPEQPLTTFDDREAVESWRLVVADTVPGNSGTLRGWSMDVTYQDCAGVAREIMTSGLDGGAADSMATLTGRVNSDVDMDPVWSPDGTKLAFVRQRWLTDLDEYGPPQVWVAPLTGGPAKRITVSPSSTTYSDEDPSWSPDGKQVVIARGVQITPGRMSAARRAEPPSFSPVADGLWVLDASGSGRSARLTFTYEFEGTNTVSLDGRSPTWSPDGEQIAYDLNGSIRLVEVAPGGPTDREYAGGTWPIADPRAVTGFNDRVSHPFDQADTPTAARRVLSVTEDPAWRSDGEELAFAGQPAGQPDQRGIWAIKPDGTGLRMLTDMHPKIDDLNQDARGPETEPAYEPLPRADVAVTVTVPALAVAGVPFVATYTLTNNGPRPAQGVVLTTTVPAGGSRLAVAPPAGCLADGSGCTFSELAPGANRVYQVELSYPAPTSGTVIGTVTSLTPDPVLANNTAYADITVGAAPADVVVTVALDQPIGYVGGHRTATFTVTNNGPGPAEGVTLHATYPVQVTPTAVPLCLVDGTSCALGTLAPAAEVTFTVDLATITAGTGSIVGDAATTTTDPDLRNNDAVAELEIVQPTIRLLPAVARPGQVVLAFGENMPPGTEITVAWEPGITVDKGPFTIAADGTMRASLLLVRRDRLGTRLLTATSVTNEFTPVTGTMLVVLRLLTPPNFIQRG